MPKATFTCTPGSNFKPVTIAVTPLVGDDGAVKLSAIVTNDFARSVFLAADRPATSFPEQIANPDVRPNLDAWKTINAQFVVTGRVRVPTALTSPPSSAYGTWPPANRWRGSNM